MMHLRSLLSFLFVLTVAATGWAKPGRVLKFEGVPANVIQQLKKRYPSAFERGVTFSEVDHVIRYLMATRTFSNIEVVERGPTGARELVLMASLVRRISEIRINGTKHLSDTEILKILGISTGQTFERKDLVAAANQLQDRYGDEGYLNARFEIDFNLPNETDVIVNISVNEGPACKVTEVHFETTNRELAARARNLSTALIAQPLALENVNDFQKKLTEYFAHNRYLTARLSVPAIVYNKDRSQAKLTYLIESAYRYEFLFDGNVFWEDGSIIRHVEIDKLFGLSTSPAPDLADRIRKLYQAYGFANVNVEYKEKVFEEIHKRQIRFTITENPRVRIRAIDVSGTISRPEKYYADFITEHSSDLIDRGFYNRKDFEAGYENLKIELQNQGYLRARIPSVRAEYSKDQNFVTIFVNIDEGPLTQIRQIKIEGATAFSKNQLNEILALKNNSPLSLNELTGSLERLKSFYHSQGYLEMKILNENVKDGEDTLVSYNDTNTQANIDIQIHEGPKVIVSSITTSGNTFTKDYVILRELEFNIGDTLTPAMIEDSIFRLQRTGLFSKVEIRTPEAGTNISERTVVVEIQERDPGLFTSGFGFTNEHDLTGRGYLGLAYRNLGGTGRALSGRVSLQYATDPDVKFLENEITLGYLEPYLFKGRNRGRINLTREQKFYDQESTTSRTLIQERNDIAFLLERDITSKLKLTYTFWGFSNQRKFDRQTYETVETQNIAKTGPLFELSYLDDPFLPTRGSYSFLNVEYSDPAIGSSRNANQTIHFIKLNAGYQHLWPILNSPRITWVNTIRGGFLSNLSSAANSGVPASEAFFLGGRTTIRGFDTSEFERVPNVYQLGKKELREFRMTNDSHFYLIKTELRFPLVRDLVDLTTFYDGGAVLISQPDVDIKDPYRDAAGFGLRFKTPVGAVSAELGFKLDRKTFGERRESEKALHIYFGSY